MKKFLISRGYKYIKYRENGKWRLKKEHRMVVEKFIGRKLLPTETIHHRNENKLDNRLENLQILSPEEHQRLHGFIK